MLEKQVFQKFTDLETKNNKLKNSSTEQRLVYNNLYDFFFDTNNIQEIQLNNYTSYIIPISRDIDNGFVENVLIHQNGLNDKIQGGCISIKIKDNHPLVFLGHILPWSEFFDIANTP